MHPEPRPEEAIEELARSIEARFDALRPWLEVPEPLWSARPAAGAWSVREILEHLARMQHHVLLLVDKIGRRSTRLVAGGTVPPSLFDPVAELARLASGDTAWRHPEHMTPTGEADRSDLAQDLEAQRRRCLDWLRRFPRGEGALHSIRMSVLGRRLDGYGWLALIDAHLARHLRQLERTLVEVSERDAREPPAAAPPPP